MLIRCSIILGSQNVDFLAAQVEITNQYKRKHITEGIFMYLRFLYTTWIAPKESNINEYLTSTQYIQSTPLKNHQRESMVHIENKLNTFELLSPVITISTLLYVIFFVRLNIFTINYQNQLIL
jgi:hypothetical protein